MPNNLHHAHTVQDNSQTLYKLDNTNYTMIIAFAFEVKYVFPQIFFDPLQVQFFKVMKLTVLEK